MSTGRGFLACSECGKDVTDEHANIMVNGEAYTKQHRYTDLRVICKPCTIIMDDRGDRKIYHSIWELYSVRDTPFGYFGRIMNDLIYPTKYKWDTAAIESVVDILIELLPNADAEGLLLSFFTTDEWHGEGMRSQLFRKHRDIGRERDKRIEREKRSNEKPIPYVRPTTDIEPF